MNFSLVFSFLHLEGIAERKGKRGSRNLKKNLRVRFRSLISFPHICSADMYVTFRLDVQLYISLLYRKEKPSMRSALLVPQPTHSLTQ